MLRTLTIKNYKSILDHTIELGRINVFIGENGCGKSNILEAVAMGAAALTDKLSVEELFSKGIRVAKPSIMRSSFPRAKASDILLRFECEFDDRDIDASKRIDLHLSAKDSAAVDTEWFERSYQELLEDRGAHDLPLPVFWQALLTRTQHGKLLGDFAIYNANFLALRGLQVTSRRTPLGIYGENLDVAISALKPKIWADVLERAKCVSWLDKVVVDPADELKYQGHKLGQSKSNLYFHDRFMQRRNNVFSAENVNEGILHVLFYLTLFVSEGTPKVFGIDNIETALNPQLCRELMKQLAELAEKHGKQALITTHNPAILDGLNLHDDEQRLFVVSRDDEGRTVTKRIKLKPEVKEGKLKLSEMWMRGHLGGLPPQRF